MNIYSNKIKWRVVALIIAQGFLFIEVKAQSPSASFEYRNILEDYIDSIKIKDIKNLFGSWLITSIADVGGNVESEKLIQEQIGDKLILSNDSLVFNFLNQTRRIYNPKYSIKYVGDDDAKTLQGTTLFYGYRPCRKSAIVIEISNQLFLEVITFEEMAYYYEGKIYFLSRK
jgi:hypothetical protein